ncbi:hypothetical protein [Rubrivirga sp.]|uniref:hypothetical protein n=1 Tax=Rubrivirga sp. TaxID=1885344 RepID=UPI003B52F397
METPPLYTDVLDAGDRVVAALVEGDLDRAAVALDDQRRLLDRIRDAALPRPPAALADRLRDQHARFHRALADRTQVLTEALAAVGRATDAGHRYAADPRASLVDTAPRISFRAGA